MAKFEKDGGKEDVITLTIKDKASLHNCYMPFINGGGLFIPNHTDYDLGDEVSVELTVMDELEIVRVTGEVVWVAKKGVKNPHVPGIGLQLNDPDNLVKDKIETYLAGSLTSSDMTATM